ncbi:LysR family transcriptional regulator substrate-binding protein [Actinobacillus suis]|nr:LysR family transcriptional regulator substrate-binding protein [Actinobacillus suis]
MNKNHKLHEMLIKQCELAGYVPEIALETESMTTAQALAGAGLGVALLPETLVSKNHFDKEPCYGELDIRRTVVIIYRKNSYLSRATRAFIQSLRELTQCPFSSEKM